MSWVDDILKQDKKPISYYENVVLGFMYSMMNTHHTTEVKPAGEGCFGGGSKNSRKREKSKKPSLATLNRKLYMEA